MSISPGLSFCYFGKDKFLSTGFPLVVITVELLRGTMGKKTCLGKKLTSGEQRGEMEGQGETKSS